MERIPTEKYYFFLYLSLDPSLFVIVFNQVSLKEYLSNQVVVLLKDIFLLSFTISTLLHPNLSVNTKLRFPHPNTTNHSPALTHIPIVLFLQQLNPR